MEASGVDTKAFQNKLEELRHQDIQKQAQVAHKLRDAEAETLNILGEEDRERSLANDIADDAAQGSKIANRASELGAKHALQQLTAESEKFQEAMLNDARKAEYEAQAITKPQQEWLTEIRGALDGTAARTADQLGRIEGTTAEKIALLDTNSDLVVKGAEHLEGRVSALDGQLSHLLDMLLKQQKQGLDVDSSTSALDNVVVPSGTAGLLQEAENTFLEQQLAEDEVKATSEEALTVEIEKHNAMVRGSLEQRGRLHRDSKHALPLKIAGSTMFGSAHLPNART